MNCSCVTQPCSLTHIHHLSKDIMWIIFEELMILQGTDSEAKLIRGAIIENRKAHKANYDANIARDEPKKFNYVKKYKLPLWLVKSKYILRFSATCTGSKFAVQKFMRNRFGDVRVNAMPRISKNYRTRSFMRLINTQSVKKFANRIVMDLLHRGTTTHESIYPSYYEFTFKDIIKMSKNVPKATYAKWLKLISDEVNGQYCKYINVNVHWNLHIKSNQISWVSSEYKGKRPNDYDYDYDYYDNETVQLYGW